MLFTRSSSVELKIVVVTAESQSSRRIALAFLKTSVTRKRYFGIGGKKKLVVLSREETVELARGAQPSDCCGRCGARPSRARVRSVWQGRRLSTSKEFE